MLEAIASRLEAITMLEAVASRLEAIRPLLVGWRPLVGGRPSLVGWRPSLCWRPSLVGWRPLLCWRPSLVGWRPLLLVTRSRYISSGELPQLLVLVWRPHAHTRMYFQVACPHGSWNIDEYRRLASNVLLLRDTQFCPSGCTVIFPSSIVQVSLQTSHGATVAGVVGA